PVADKESFQKLADQAKTKLDELAKAESSDVGKTFGGFQQNVQGQTGVLSFTARSDVLGVLSADIGWRAKYEFKEGKWEYVSSERQVAKDPVQAMQGKGEMKWVTPRPDDKDDARIVAILKSLR